MSCPEKEGSKLLGPTSVVAETSAKALKTVKYRGKYINFDVELLKKKAIDNDLDDTTDFEDWDMFAYSNSGERFAFFSFNDLEPSSSRSSKRVHAFNPIVAKFIDVKYPNFTPIFPPVMEMPENA